jgi:hypothetical protein
MNPPIGHKENMMMNWLTRWTQKGTANAARVAPRQARFMVENLEDRMVLSTLPSVEATPVFLGPAWQNQLGNELAIVGATQGIVNGPFMDALQNAGYAVGRGQVSGAQTLAAPGVVAGATVSDAQVQEILKDDIVLSALGLPVDASTPLAQPDANRLYTVFLPANVTFTASDGTQTFSSATNMSGWNNEFFIGNTAIHYLVIPTPGGTNVSANGQPGMDAVTESLSHEIAESVVGQQIADQTENFHVRMSNGIAVQEVGQPGNFGAPIAIPGATPLPF